MAGKKPDYDVFNVRNYEGEGGEEKGYWTKIGVAWKNADGSINVQLSALPIDGKLNIREPRPAREGE